MKDLDKKILQILQEDSEISMEELGSKVNLSPSPCYRRVKNLKDKGYIDKNVAVLNKKKLNLERPYFVHVKTCLLYTSPSPRDATLSRMPSSA